jgi:uridine kinase
MGHLILIGGGSAAGKSQLARDVADRFRTLDAAVFSHDAYYRDVSHMSARELARHNFDHPAAIDFPLLIQHIDALLDGQRVALPQYDFVHHTRTPGSVQLGPVDIVVVEGILVLSSEELIAKASLTLFVDTDADIRLARRLRRDVQGRGIPFEHVLVQYLKVVKPMHDAFVEPSRRRADLVVRGDRPAERTLKMLDGFVLRAMLDDTLEERR